MSIAELVERAFDYRGFVTVSRRDGARVVGFLYDRGPAHVELYDERAEERIRVPLDDIADIAFTGEDTAAAAQQIWERRHGRLDKLDVRPVLIVVALPMELAAVAQALDAKVKHGAARGELGESAVIVRAIGMGGGAAHVIAQERPRLVIGLGFAGALAPSLAPGDLVLASAVCDEGGEVLIAPESVRQRCREVLVPFVEGELACVTRVAATAAEKRALVRQGRLAVDLESWAIAHAAQRAKLPWLAVRAIVDSLERTLPAFTLESRGHITGALRHALGGPRGVLELAQLGIASRAAKRALRRAVTQLAPILAEDA